MNPSAARSIPLLAALLLAGPACDASGLFQQDASGVPRGERWGIYSMDLSTQDVASIYGSPDEIANLDLNSAGDRIAFSQKADGQEQKNFEIFTIGTDGQELERLTRNGYMDTYPAWSPDGTQIAYLSWPDTTLDIYRMQSDGSQAGLLYDSGGHDADIDWVGDRIVFTRDSRIWIMQSDGTDARPLTDPPRAGETGNANLPFGDYDPRISPDGSQVVFERLVDDASPHGNYDLFMIRIDGTGLRRLTETGYSQGMAGWSPAGDLLIYIVTAEGGNGVFDAYILRPDGSGNRNITPDSFPVNFLLHMAVFSNSASTVYFIGEWWS
jgi:Tol biopolymer transport system component